jgi:hypothetical protein
MPAEYNELLLMKKALVNLSDKLYVLITERILICTGLCPLKIKIKDTMQNGVYEIFKNSYLTPLHYGIPFVESNHIEER